VGGGVMLQHDKYILSSNSKVVGCKFGGIVYG
jgi:hypothetical protein